MCSSCVNLPAEVSGTLDLVLKTGHKKRRMQANVMDIGDEMNVCLKVNFAEKHGDRKGNNTMISCTPS